MHKTNCDYSSRISEGNLSFLFKNALVFGIALWVLCFLLANLEVQIEGAERLGRSIAYLAFV